MNNETDALVQKYLGGKTTREEEKELLDICLSDVGMIIEKYRQVKLMKGDEEWKPVKNATNRYILIVDMRR